MTDASASPLGPRPIVEVAERLGITSDELTLYGRDKAKIDLRVASGARRRPGRAKLILVSAITPTPAGEGKTTTSIGLGQALARLGESACVALRQPSLGPCLGMKGGATGGGQATVVPSESINLHFTGDLHAITSAHNLLAALLDNHLHFGNERGIDPTRASWRRAIDMNDRALRNIVVGLGGTANGVPRETGFDITASSEVMAAFCLAADLDDLRARLERILVAFDASGRPIHARDLAGVGAMIALLKDAFAPNLVQTSEGSPVLVHGGPFANIAHGCSSVVATKTAMNLADWTVTEAGFGFDLGAEKFFDIKCRSAGLDTSAVVLVATLRALKMHGGVALADVAKPDRAGVERGLPNLEKHIENIQHFGEAPVVALNRFATDTDEEIEVVRQACSRRQVAFAVTDHFARGGEGAMELARVVMGAADKEAKVFRPLYALEDGVVDKIRAVATRMYGARDVVLTKRAARDLEDVKRLGFERLPVCIAKTQSSLSDDPTLRGRPKDFDVTVQAIHISAGAGFLVVMTGEILRMPGLPKHPQAELIDVKDGAIVGIK